MHTLVAVLIRLLFWVIRCLPVRLAGALGAGIGRCAFYLVRRSRQVALRNMARIYPDKSRNWRRYQARESFAELGRTMFELPHVFLRSKKFLRSRVTIEGEETFRAAMQQGQGVFATAAHHSNWELGALMVSILGYPTDIIYRPMKNQALDNYLKQCRGRFGCSMQSRGQNLRWLPKALKNGHAIAVMIDQHMSQGAPVPFLGHMANTTTMPAAFIMRQQTPMFGVALMRHGASFRFTLRFWPITIPVLRGDKESDAWHIMHATCQSFEPILHERPPLWLWVHRRWYILEQNQEIAEVVHGTP